MAPTRFIDVNYEESDAEKAARETMEEIQEQFNRSAGEQDWEIKIFRVSGNNKLGFKQPYLFSVLPTELPVEQKLLDEYGSGKYLARVMVDGKLTKAFNIEVEASARLRQQDSARPSGDMATFIQLMEASNSRIVTMLERLMAAPPPAADPLAMMERMSAIMANMKTAMPETSAAAPAAAMEMFQKGIELAQSLAGAGGGETSAMDVLKSVVSSPAVSNLVAVIMGRAIPGGGGQPAASGYTPAAAQRPAMTLPPVMPANRQGMSEADVVALIRGQIDFLILQANAGRDPFLYAEMMLDNLPEPMIMHLLDSPNVIGELVAINPAMGNYMPWFTKLIEAMRELAQGAEPELQPGEDDASPAPAVADVPNPGRPAGNVGNPAAHVKPRKSVQKSPPN